MTWFAHQVFAEAVALPALAAAYPGHVFHVRDLSAYRRVRREVYEVEITPTGSRNVERDVVSGPVLPRGGLVIVRELCTPGSSAASWFGDDALSWLDRGGAAVADGEALPPTLVLGGGGPTTTEGREWAEHVDVVLAGGEENAGPRSYWPPVLLLASLRAQSRATASVVSLCCAATWGGDLEYAFAWVFDGRAGADCAYVRELDGQVRVWSATAPPRSRLVVDGDVLTLTLIHHGLLLRDGYFELHTRKFPWEQHRAATL